MRCPNCGSTKSIVKEKRPVKNKPEITRRRRECLVCKTRWTTHELLAGKVDKPASHTG